MSVFEIDGTYKFKKGIVETDDPYKTVVYTYVSHDNYEIGHFSSSTDDKLYLRRYSDLEPCPKVQAVFQYKERIQFAIGRDGKWSDGFFIADLRNTPGFDGETPYLVASSPSEELLYCNCVRKPLIELTLSVTQEQLDAITTIISA